MSTDQQSSDTVPINDDSTVVTNDDSTVSANTDSKVPKPELYHHVMVDLETLGLNPGCVIASLAAVEFDPMTGLTNHTFYKKINIASSLREGFKIEGDTLYWWLQQTDAARTEICTNSEDIHAVLSEFTSFLKQVCKNTKYIKLYGNGSSFDLGILGAAYHQLGQKIPWMFWNERDVRTIVDFMPEIKKQTEFEGVMHHPIHDCLHQIKYVSKIYSILTKASSS